MAKNEVEVECGAGLGTSAAEKLVYLGRPRLESMSTAQIDLVLDIAWKSY
jgi:hypothetical protein